MKNELRLGNYINESNRVLSITDSGILCTGLSMIGVVLIENPKPIPLTEEWLLKFGFEKHNTEYWYKDIFVGLNDYSFNLKEGIGVYLTDVLYVHSLQNIYFALNNEELTIKQ